MDFSLSLPEETPRNDKLRFHERCGSLVKLSNGHRSAERRRPLDEFNNGVVMTYRSLRDSELFEIRIDRLVDKWSESIEVLTSSKLVKYPLIDRNCFIDGCDYPQSLNSGLPCDHD